MSLWKKVLPIFLSAVTLGLVIWQVTPPESLKNASARQLATFFIPIFTFLTFLLNLYFRFFLKSAVTSLCFILFLILQGSDRLNVFTIIFVLTLLGLTIKYLKKPNNSSYQTKIPRLSRLQRQ